MKKTIILILSALMAFSVSAVAADFSQESSISDKKPKKTKAPVKEVTFKVHLDCPNCVKKVQENLAFEKGVKDLHICMEDQIVAVKYDSAKTDEEKLKNALVKLGIPVEGVSHHGHQHNH